MGTDRLTDKRCQQDDGIHSMKITEFVGFFLFFALSSGCAGWGLNKQQGNIIIALIAIDRCRIIVSFKAYHKQIKALSLSLSTFSAN